VDRADEEAHRALMRKHLEEGRRDTAIRQFYRLRDVLRVDLGVAPVEETVALFESAIQQRRPLLPTVTDRAQALIARGLVAWSRGDVDTTASLAEEVRGLAIEHHLYRELGEACVLLGMTAYVEGRWREHFRSEFDRAVRLPDEAAVEVFDAHVCLAETTLEGADVAAVAQLAHELLKLAERAGSLRGQALASLLIGEAEFALHDWQEAERWLEIARGRGAQAGSQSIQALALVRLAEMQGGERAERALAQAIPLAEASPLAPHLVVRVHAAALATAPSAAAIRRVLETAETGLRPGEFCAPCSIGFRINAVHACVRAGELARARSCLAAAEALTGMWQGGPWRAAAWEARAALRAAEGDAETAAGLLREARDLFAESGRPFDAQRCEDKLDRVVARNVLGTPAS